MTPARGAYRPANDEHRDTLAAIEAALQAALKLRPDWNDPERFHVAKSELVSLLRGLASQPVLVRQVVRQVRIEVPIERIVEKVAVVPAPARPRVRRRHRYPLPPAGPGGLL